MQDDFSFSNITPHLVLNGIEALGFECDGRLFELNSFENRVFQIGLEDQSPIVAKFYRPLRWTTLQIQEEHDFTRTLEEDEVPAIAPMAIDGKSIFDAEGYRFSLYRRQGGYPPELDITSHLESIGRTLGRIHAYGSTQQYKHRGNYPFHAMGSGSAAYLLEKHVPAHFQQGYRDVTARIADIVANHQSNIEKLPYLRIHGDCHLGNILWQDPKPFFLDFDDSVNGPQIADIWMLFSGSLQK
jgi:Ser/Thr protein kinase RdoA (MazF antagonist)